MIILLLYPLGKDKTYRHFPRGKAAFKNSFLETPP